MINKLLSIKPNSAKIFLLLFPPIYSLWLLALGRKLLLKQNKPSLFYTIIASINFILFTINFCIPIYLLSKETNIILSLNELKEVLFITAFFWIITAIILSYLTVKQDRYLKKTQYQYGVTDSLDFIKRFLIFIYWPLYVWSFQSIVNNYIKKDII